LRHSPNCTMLFNKFVPAYHHHFGHQCRVSDYGFSKLIELFEAIPDVVKIQELSEGERTVSLTLNQSFKVLGSQVVSLVRNSPTSSLPLDELPRIYLKECGYPLKPHVYECETFLELIEKICDYIQVFGRNGCSRFGTVQIFRLWRPPPVYCLSLWITTSSQS
jgi:meiosis arrest female protein 1